MELLASGASSKPLTDNESLVTSLERLRTLMEKAHSYVDDVVVSLRGLVMGELWNACGI